MVLHRLFGLIVTCIMLVATTSHARPRAMILGIDGLRGDALHEVLVNGKAPAIQMLITHGRYAKCPRADAPSCAHAHSGNDYHRDFVWKTGPGWGSVISGLDANRHQIKNIGHDAMKVFANVTQTYPTIFNFLKRNGLRTAAAGVGAFLTSLDGKSVYPGITDYECGSDKKSPQTASSKSGCNLNYRATFNNEDEQRDDKIADAAVSWINGRDIGFIMVVLDKVDAKGHETGFEKSSKYLAAISDADKRVARILAAIDNRARAGDEEWLVILTSDHGGHNQSGLLSWIPGVNNGIHGTASGKDNIVPFIVGIYARSSRFIVDDFASSGDVRHFDTFKTIARWFGFDNAARDRDGNARIVPR